MVVEHLVQMFQSRCVALTLEHYGTPQVQGSAHLILRHPRTCFRNRSACSATKVDEQHKNQMPLHTDDGMAFVVNQPHFLLRTKQTRA